jgi:hypothetical protein
MYDMKKKKNYLISIEAKNNVFLLSQIIIEALQHQVEFTFNFLLQAFQFLISVFFFKFSANIINIKEFIKIFPTFQRFFR